MYLRRVKGKRQLDRIHKLAPGRKSIVQQRLQLPDVIKVSDTIIDHSIRKRRANENWKQQLDAHADTHSAPKKCQIPVLPHVEGSQGE